MGRIVIEFGLVRRFPGYRVSGTSKGYQPQLTVPWVGTERSKRLGNRVTPEMGGGSERWILGRYILISFSNVYGTISQSQVWYVPMISGGFRLTVGTMETSSLMATRLRADGGWNG